MFVDGKYDRFSFSFPRDSRYMRMRVPYMARGPHQLTVPGGAMVFLFGEEDRDGMATVIYDGQVRIENKSYSLYGSW